MPKVTQILEQSSGTRQVCISVFLLFWLLVKSHNMVVKSADHANDVVVLLFCVFFFLARTVFRESSMKMNVKNKYATFSHGLFNK